MYMCIGIGMFMLEKSRNTISHQFPTSLGQFPSQEHRRRWQGMDEACGSIRTPQEWALVNVTIGTSTEIEIQIKQGSLSLFFIYPPHTHIFTHVYIYIYR